MSIYVRLYVCVRLCTQGEIQLLRQLDHPNIVRYIDFFQGADSLHIILEYIENGSLHDIVSQYASPSSRSCSWSCSRARD